MWCTPKVKATFGVHHKTVVAFFVEDRDFVDINVFKNSGPTYIFKSPRLGISSILENSK